MCLNKSTPKHVTTGILENLIQQSVVEYMLSGTVNGLKLRGEEFK